MLPGICLYIEGRAACSASPCAIIAEGETCELSLLLLTFLFLNLYPFRRPQRKIRNISVSASNHYYLFNIAFSATVELSQHASSLRL